MSPSRRGALALTPLLVFLLVYLVTSLAVGDFYKVPVSAAFLIASIYAICITSNAAGASASKATEATASKATEATASNAAGATASNAAGATASNAAGAAAGTWGGKLPLRERIAIFSEGAGDKNVLLMIWIFVLAGAFASTAKAIGSIDATVNLTLSILPAKFLFAGLFLAACFISLSIGTSVGTVVALVPLAGGLAADTGMSLPLITAIIVGGAFFGDNLSFISDTTIAATQSQGCSMTDKFKANLWIAAPAAVAVAALYLAMGLRTDVVPQAGPVDILLLVPYLAVIVLALTGLDVILVLTSGLGLNLAIGLLRGTLGWSDFLSAIGNGIAGMGDLIIVTLLAGGMLALIRHGGGLDALIQALTRRIRGKRGAELSIAALVSLANLCTANNTIAIITTGGIARDITEKYKLDPRKSASILDTFSCLMQGLLPYGAQLLMAASLSGAGAFEIIGRLYYPFALGIAALLAILLRLPVKYR